MFEISSDFEKSEVLTQVYEIIKNDCQDYSDDVTMALYDMWKKSFLNNTNQTGFICRSNSDDFAGIKIGRAHV